MFEAIFNAMGYSKTKTLMHRIQERQSKINQLRNEIARLQRRLDIQSSSKIVPGKKEK